MSKTNIKIVKVKNGFNSGGAVELNLDAMLRDIRTTLEGQTLMEVDQFFLVSGSPLVKKDEATTPLSEVLTKPAVGPYLLTVGTGSIPISGDKDWNKMSAGQQATVLNDVAQVTKGLSLSCDEGLYKVTYNTIQPVISGKSQWISAIPRVESSITTNSYFSKYASSLATSSTNGGSLSLDTPYGGGSASYEHAEKQGSSHSTVETYSVGTYNVNKVDVVLDDTQFELTTEFYNALSAAASLKGKQTQFVGVVQALNKYGWYVPVKMTLGGVLLTSQKSESISWSESQTTTNTFSASFKASFDGIGGGAAYKHSDKSHTSSSGSHGSASLSFTAIGGSASDANNFTNWAKSLEPASAWSTSELTEVVSSLYPLLNMGGDNKALLYYIKNLMAEQYASCPELEQLQPLIDVGSYVTALNNLLPQQV